MTYYEGQRAKRKIWNSIKSDEEKAFAKAIKDGFPWCKGTYPDCPENPSKEESQCISCPVLEEIMEK